MVSSKSSIYRTIKERILSLEYPPRQILNEKALADEFGVSRTPLREVLSRLHQDKLVAIVPRAGTMVTPVEFQALRDVFQTRVEIEGLVGRLAAERVTNDQLQEMRKLQKECKRISAGNNPTRLVGIDIRFREVLTGAANNQILKEISDYLYNLTVRVWYLVFDKQNLPKEVEIEMNEIDQTIKVLTKRDPCEAQQFRRNVIINYVERVKHQF